MITKIWQIEKEDVTMERSKGDTLAGIASKELQTQKWWPFAYPEMFRWDNSDPYLVEWRSSYSTWVYSQQEKSASTGIETVAKDRATFK